MHHISLVSITLFAAFHAYLSQVTVSASRINREQNLGNMFNFYKSNKCPTFGTSKLEHYDSFDHIMNSLPGLLLVIFIIPALWINRQLVINDQMIECTIEQLRLLIARHNILIIIVFSDLVLDIVFNILDVDLLHGKSVGRIC